MASSNVAYPPFDAPIVDKNGMLSPEWQAAISSNFAQATDNFGVGGLGVPELASGEVGRTDNGIMQYNTTDDQLQVYKSGALHNITTSVALETQGGVQMPTINDVTNHENPTPGLVIFDTSDSTLKVYDGTLWADLH